MEPAQDEDDLYDLLHDEIAASRSRPRPGGAEDDEEQRQDTKVRATHPRPHHPRLRATPAQRAARWWRAAAEAGAGGEDGAVRRAAAAGRRPAVAGEPRRRPHGPAAALVSQGRRRQVKKLTRMKETLADNISSLFKTAAGEIARKDAQNKELSARCARPARLRRRAAQPQLRRFRAVTGSAQHAGRS